jgi:hypothetical protein
MFLVMFSAKLHTNFMFTRHVHCDVMALLLHAAELFLLRNFETRENNLIRNFSLIL